MAEPINIKLYNNIKEDAKKKFKGRYPSVYASSWIVSQYKERGGKYAGEKPKDTGLTRWYKEQWIDTCKYIKQPNPTKKQLSKMECGRDKIPKNPEEYKKTFPYCRPYKRITNDTPKTLKEMSKKELKKVCATKKKNPKKKTEKA
jgi:hypothetical protein